MMVLYKLIADRGKRLEEKERKLALLQDELKLSHAVQLDELEDKQKVLEEKLIGKVEQSPKAMKKFLRNILLLENLMNSFYTAQLRKNQKSARANMKDAKHFEEKALVKKTKKLLYNAKTFGDIYNAAKKQKATFDKFCKKLSSAIGEDKLKNFPASANLKKGPRSFYKAYFWYDGKEPHNKLSDLLRTSFVFNSFDDLYAAYAVIRRTDHCRVVRVKDRFAAASVPFGYRDCLLNVLCPGIKDGSTPLVCEVQLHHKCFYDNKKDSHAVYKLARLFEDKVGKGKSMIKTNFAYEAARKHYAAKVGKKVYKKEVKFDSDDSDESDDEELEEKLEAAKKGIEEGLSIEQLTAKFKNWDADYDSSDSGSDWSSSSYSDFEDEKSDSD